MIEDHRSRIAKAASLGLMYGSKSVHGTWSGRLPSVQNLPRPWYAVTQPRHVIAGEDTTPRGGFRVYTCWTRESSGYIEGLVAYDVWARDPDEAARVISPRINTVEVSEK